MGDHTSSPCDGRIEVLAGIRLIHAQRILQMCNEVFRQGTLLLYQKQETGGYGEKATIIGFRVADGGKP
jgi:hypothetical protein